MLLTLPLAQVATTRTTLRLHIEAVGAGYKLFLFSDDEVRWYRSVLGVTATDLEDLNHTLQAALEDVADGLDARDEPARSDDGLLTALAQSGEYVFNQLFPDPVIRDVLRSGLHRDGLVVIASEEFLLPWELLYTPGGATRPDIMNFWGMGCIVARPPGFRQEAASGWAGPSRSRPVISADRPQLGLIASDRLDSVREIEIPALLRLHEAGAIRLHTLSALASSDRDGGLGRFRSFLGERRDILHLACHAEDWDPMPRSRLEISTAFPITLLDLNNESCRIPQGAFVMLNACRTGAMSPGSSFNWSTEFLRKGASGVLATEFRVLDDFAAHFAAHFYDEFLAGRTVGEAVTATRRHFWETEGNPLGLGYSLYSFPEICIKAVRG